MVQQKLVHWTGTFCGVASDMSRDKTMAVKIRHWLPIITYCPVNNLPDLIYVTVKLRNDFAELYALRKRIRKLCKGRKMFMENLATLIFEELEKDGIHSLESVEVRLAFDRHVVTISKRS